MRLYFDNHRVIESGLAVRDGLHVIKVHDQLPLEGFLIASIGAADVDPEGAIREWTPAAFVEKADALFRDAFRHPACG